MITLKMTVCGFRLYYYYSMAVVPIDKFSDKKVFCHTSFANGKILQMFKTFLFF